MNIEDLQESIAGDLESLEFEMSDMDARLTRRLDDLEEELALANNKIVNLELDIVRLEALMDY